MNYKELIKDLKNNCLGNLFLFYGRENYLIENTIHVIKEKMIDKGFEDLNFQAIDGKDTSVDAIINACETLPFMGEKRMIIVKDLECFSGKVKNIREEDEERILKYCGNLPSTTYLFFVVTEEMDKRRKIVKTIGKYGKIVQFDKLEEKDVYKWIQKTFKKYNKQIKEKEMAYFIELIGYLDKHSIKTLKDLENEINKLSSYVGDRTFIAKEDIDLLASKSIENDIFSLVESIGEKNGDKALALLNDMLIEGEAEIKILYMITRQFRYLFQMKIMEKQGYTAMAIGPKLGLKPFVVKKYLKQAMNFHMDGLKQALEQCLYTDESIKRGMIDQRLAIELLITEFTR